MPEKSCIKNGRLILHNKIENNRSVFIEDGKIVDISKPGKRPYKEFKIIDAKGSYVSPGFIDIHVHDLLAGGFNGLTEDDLMRMCRNMSKGGVTSFLATTVSLPTEILLKIAKTVRSFLTAHRDTNLLGLHLEGPYLNTSFSGAQNRKFIRTFDPDELNKIFSAADGSIKMATFAPEQKNGMKLLSFLVKCGVIPSAGHSQAGYEEIKDAVKKGLKNVTHLFNAMPGFYHRDPGLVGAALDLDGLTVDIIADGLHLSPEIIKLIVKTKGVDKVILISDSIAAGRKVMLGGLKVYIKNGQARLKNGRLAGSLLSLNQAVKNVMRFASINMIDAVKMATSNPARLLGIQDRKGSIEAGKDADIVIFDGNFKVKFTIINGKIWN